jgi:penicillin-insensitive murein DD-endopeptidase
MVRILAAIALILALGSCRGDGGGVTETLSTQNANDTRIAKSLFGAAATPAALPLGPIGGFAQGCQAGAVQLPETGPTWQAMRLSRNRNWAQPVTVDFIQDLSAFAATQSGWAGLYVGDMSQPRGGPMLTGHRSHQTGLDADIWMLPPDSLTLSASARESISSIQMDRSSGAYVNSSWTPQHEAILRAAAQDPRVNRIFVFPGAKVEMCANATGNRDWLHKIRPWYGHNFHFHVRLNCPAGARNCESQSDIPAGDGCADAQEWVNNILNPPPPDPNAQPPEPTRDLTMANLPGQCLDVLNSN